MPDDDDPTPHAADAAAPASSPGPVPLTLKPFLDNLPSPASLSERTAPSASIRHGLVGRDEPTPTKTIFGYAEDDGDENEGEEAAEDDGDENEGEEAAEDDGDENEVEEGDEDEEFESHYSRQSSPATSTDSETEHDIEQAEVTAATDDLDLNEVQRVSSAPLSATANGSAAGPDGNLHLLRPAAAWSRGPPPIPPPLYPPFYNKPPTPLPPSPSLTSLLRPPSLLNRSTTSTRATSPDSSDVETPNDTEAQVVQQARRANPPPPTAPKVPTYEYYGFVLYLASSLTFLMYILWSYLPSPFLHALGITYYPDRWWALAIPAWIVVVLIYIYVALACYNVEYLTLGLHQLETMVDETGSVAILDESGRIRKGGSKRYVAEMEERKKREAIMQGWERKKKGAAGSGRGAKKKDKREKDRDKVDEWYGYTGAVTEHGVASGLSWRQIWNEGTDAVMDVPLGGVCEVLYGEGKDIL